MSNLEGRSAWRWCVADQSHPAGKKRRGAT